MLHTQINEVNKVHQAYALFKLSGPNKIHQITGKVRVTVHDTHASYVRRGLRKMQLKEPKQHVTMQSHLPLCATFSSSPGDHWGLYRTIPWPSILCRFWGLDKFLMNSFVLAFFVTDPHTKNWQQEQLQRRIFVSDQFIGTCRITNYFWPAHRHIFKEAAFSHVFSSKS